MDIFWEFLLKNLWNNSARLKQFTKQGFNNKQTIEKEFFIHIIEICCYSGMLVKSYRYWLLNWQPKGGNLLSDLLPSEVTRFRALVSFMYSQCTLVRGNDVMANGMRHQQKIQNFVQEFNCWYWFVSISDIKKNNVFDVNPALRNSKYAFLFPFSIVHVYITQEWDCFLQDGWLHKIIFLGRMGLLYSYFIGKWPWRKNTIQYKRRMHWDYT